MLSLNLQLLRVKISYCSCIFNSTDLWIRVAVSNKVNGLINVRFITIFIFQEDFIGHPYSLLPLLQPYHWGTSHGCAFCRNPEPYNMCYLRYSKHKHKKGPAKLVLAVFRRTQYNIGVGQNTTLSNGTTRPNQPPALLLLWTKGISQMPLSGGHLHRWGKP